MIFSENIGSQLSMDDTSLSHYEFHTIVTNKSAIGKKGALVAIVKQTNKTVIAELQRILAAKRHTVTQITLDLAPTIELIAKRRFPNVVIVSASFHVQKLAADAVQELQIKYRCEAIEQENSD